ncbi:unnamed protein product [Haemonchus placei]|uniref:Polyprotein n=1 Tax=Haemonchus placei TaxID=6290 RepID=A0A0N4W6P5_HAEPC|nr:unnamed protein product [Haemonchus placei]
MDEISYPSSERKVRGRKVVQSDESGEGESTLLMYDTCAEISTIQDVKQARLAYSGMPIVTGNNCNGNKLFVDDMPFWWSDEVSDITDSELVMNASVLIEALEGRLKLVPMPDVEIVLDPIEDVTILRTRDKLCFRREHIFGNTVRSMVNLNGERPFDVQLNAAAPSLARWNIPGAKSLSARLFVDVHEIMSKLSYTASHGLAFFFAVGREDIPLITMARAPATLSYFVGRNSTTH